MTKKQSKKSHAPRAHGFRIKKQFGQHFLREQAVVDSMLQAVQLDEHASILEIGCGDGFLTRSLHTVPHERLWVFEIDPDWVAYVSHTYPHPQMSIFCEDILAVDFEQRLVADAPWTILANLPYQITFPFLLKLQQHRQLFGPSVIMIQEEVAQKLVASSGRVYSFVSVFFQHFFEFCLLKKVSPGAFVPPPNVDSRLLWLKPRVVLDVIPKQELFWKFLKLCFRQPRRTIRNNLLQSQFDVRWFGEQFGHMRAQQLTKQQFLDAWLQAINKL